MQGTSFRSYVAAHPRTIGALFTLCLLLTQAGTALGSGCRAFYGP